MGKSFNDDIFNNNLNIDSINGLNISKEAIEENREKNKSKNTMDEIKERLKDINLDEYKEEQEKTQLKARFMKKDNEKDLKTELDYLQQEQERIEETKKQQERIEQIKMQKQEQENKTIYVKKTMIFKQDYLDIIDGLSEINDIDKKDVLNQLLERAINQLDEKIKDRALKTGKKIKPKKESKSIY